MSWQLAAIPTLLLFLLLQMLQLGSPQDWPAGKCSFAAQYGPHSRRIVPNSTMGRMRTWHTKVLGQYSPLTGQLVLLFPTPEWSRELGQIQVTLAECGSPGRQPFTVVNQSDQHSVHQPGGTGVTVITIDDSELAGKLATGEFRFCLELVADVRQVRIVGGAQNPMPNGCSVALRPMLTKTTPATVNGRDSGNGAALPSALADHLWRHYRLAAVEATCCLVYVGSQGISVAEGSTSAELVALCYTGAVCLVCSAVAAIYCLVGARYRAGKTTAGGIALLPCAARRRQYRLPVTRICRYHIPDLCGPPYQHLLMHCRSVGSGVPISSAVTFRPAAAFVD